MTIRRHGSPSVLAGHKSTGRVGESVGDNSLVNVLRQSFVLEPVSEWLVQLFHLLHLFLLSVSLVTKLETLLRHVLELLPLKLRKILEGVFIDWFYQIEHFVSEGEGGMREGKER